MSYPTPDQVENCGPEEAKKLAKEFVTIKQNEINFSMAHDEQSFLYLDEQNSLLKEKFKEYQGKLKNLPSGSNSLPVRKRYNHEKFLEILKKVKNIREQHKVFQNKKNEAMQMRENVKLGLATFQKRFATEGEDAKLILKEMWADERFTCWSNVMFGQLEEEWMILKLTQHMDRCLVEIRTVL
ncbi:unnamed protein product [Orchesella dallaii]|uniref:Uncharacterized protein n=1 Tax=Orchesella dallaii TaxID=48710 RepID=A0ABP1R4E4_9HEXA